MINAQPSPTKIYEDKYISIFLQHRADGSIWFMYVSAESNGPTAPVVFYKLKGHPDEYYRSL